MREQGMNPQLADPSLQPPAEPPGVVTRQCVFGFGRAEREAWRAGDRAKCLSI